MQLGKKTNIIIKEAGKEGIVVTMSTKHYCKIIHDHLNGNQIYKKADSTCGNIVMNKIKN